MLNICLFITLICSSVVICGAFFHRQDLFLKILFLNAGTSLASLFICFLGSIKANSTYLDIALIYFLLSTVATSAYLKYFIQKDQDRQSHEKQ
jgi:multisubunit Na+/H+ antiporter MnhF subunit